MVNVTKGVLVECDPAMKQFLLHLDERNEFGRKFVLQDLDDTHLFVSSDIIETLQEKIDELMDQMSFYVSEK
ncbi:unnamed protein product [Candidula unifasciata]|uniref:General transcription and DNA repair factor IIH subunit TFB5 n=1 Tax=Candidula unifasciata TaxID=100452 RepID=A0A8S3ZBZ4_9EUPU|nr:unnamed protein product [Candidula unifasciata]